MNDTANLDRDLDRVLEAWLRPGASDLPSDRFEAIVAGVGRTRQRRRPRFDLRARASQPLNWAMAAAVVGLVVVAGTWLLGGWAGPGVAGRPAGPNLPAPLTSPVAAVVPIVLTTRDFAFDPSAVSVPSGAQVRITLVNNDGQGVPHGLEIFAPGGTVVFTGPIVAGTAAGASSTFDLPPLADGRYLFDDPVHPNMAGVLYVGEPVPPSTATPPADALPPADVVVTTRRGALDPAGVSFEGGRRFVIEFNNTDEGVEHRILIGGPDGSLVFAAGPVTGPGTIRYHVDALPAGVYALFDPASPDMVATLTIGDAAGPGGASGSLAPGSLAPADGATLNLAAQGLTFDQADLYAPSGTPFTIRVDNLDNGIPHGFNVLSAAGRLLVSGGIVNGPGVLTVSVPALPAGTYTFQDPIHGPTMTGTLHVGEAAPAGTPTP